MIQPDEICATTNKIWDLLSKSQTAPTPRIEDELITQALIESCDLLSRVVSDRIELYYEKSMRHGDHEAIKIKRYLKNGAVELVSMDMSHFEGFLNREAELLKASGLSKYIVDDLIKTIHSEIDELRYYRVSGEGLATSLSKLKMVTCKRKEDMLIVLKKGRTKKILIRGLGGISLISVNIFAHSSLSPVGVAASSGLGSVLLSKSVETLLDELRM